MKDRSSQKVKTLLFNSKYPYKQESRNNKEIIWEGSTKEIPEQHMNDVLLSGKHTYDVIENHKFIIIYKDAKTE